MFNNNSSVSTSVNTTTTTNNGCFAKKPPVGRPTLSSTSTSLNCFEEDTRTPHSLVCTSPSSMFGVAAGKKQHNGREVLANITNSKNSTSTNGLNKRSVSSRNSNLKENPCCSTTTQCSTTSLNQNQYFANGKTEATVYPLVQTNYHPSNSNTQGITQNQQLYTSRQQKSHHTENRTFYQGQKSESTNTSQESTSPTSCEGESTAAFNDFTMDSADEYECSSDEEMHDSDDEIEQQQTPADPDVYNHVDKQRLQTYMDFNIRNPVNLFPKSSDRTKAFSWAHLPIDVEDNILSYLFNNQNSKQASPHTWLSLQKNVNIKMRTMLVEWIAGVAVSFKLLPETLYLSIDILDRFMCKVCITNIKLLQGYGLACLLIASKYCETSPPPLRQLLFAADNTYSRRLILALESEICNALDFELCSIQSFDFVEKFLEVTGSVHDLLVKHLAYYICEMQLQNFESLLFKKSNVAFSAVIIALYVTNKQWSVPSIAFCLGLSSHYLNGMNTPQDIQLIVDANNCLMNMYNYYVQMSLDRNPNNFIKDKFSRPSFASVAVNTAPTTYTHPRI